MKRGRIKAQEALTRKSMAPDDGAAVVRSQFNLMKIQNSRTAPRDFHPRTAGHRCLCFLQRGPSGWAAELSRASAEKGEGNQRRACGDENTGSSLGSILPSARAAAPLRLSSRGPHRETSPRETHRKDAPDFGPDLWIDTTDSSQDGDFAITIGSRGAGV